MDTQQEQGRRTREKKGGRAEGHGEVTISGWEKKREAVITFTYKTNELVCHGNAAMPETNEKLLRKCAFNCALNGRPEEGERESKGRGKR